MDYDTFLLYKQFINREVGTCNLKKNQNKDPKYEVTLLLLYQ